VGGGSKIDPPTLWKKIRVNPPWWGVGGLPADPSPPPAQIDPPLSFLGRSETTLSDGAMIRKTGKTACNNAYIPVLERGVNGRPPPPLTFKIDLTPPPCVRGGMLRPPHQGRKLRENRVTGTMPDRNPTSGMMKKRRVGAYA